MRRRAMVMAMAVAAVAACRDDVASPPRPTPPPAPAADLAGSLAAVVADLAAAPEPLPAARAVVDRWQLPADALARLTVATVAGHAADYPAAARAHRDELAAALVALAARRPAPRITTRRHLAGDPALSPRQTRLRWALPVGNAALIALADGAVIDAVFIHDGTAWRSLHGLDELMLDAVGAATAGSDAAGCDRLVAAATEGRCLDAAWPIADAALRGDRARAVHACAVAAGHCPPAR